MSNTDIMDVLFSRDGRLAYIESVRAVMDPNPMPPGIHQYSVIVPTPQREMKFTAPTKERHDIWYNVSSLRGSSNANVD